MRFRFVQENREEHPVTLMCQLLDVSRAGFYAWLGRPVPARRRRRAELAVRARAVHESTASATVALMRASLPQYAPCPSHRCASS